MLYHVNYLNWGNMRDWVPASNLRIFHEEDGTEARRPEYVVTSQKYEAQHKKALQLANSCLKDPMNSMHYLNVQLLKEDATNEVNSHSTELLNNAEEKTLKKFKNKKRKADMITDCEMENTVKSPRLLDNVVDDYKKISFSSPKQMTNSGAETKTSDSKSNSSVSTTRFVHLKTLANKLTRKLPPRQCNRNYDCGYEGENVKRRMIRGESHPELCQGGFLPAAFDTPVVQSMPQDNKSEKVFKQRRVEEIVKRIHLVKQLFKAENDSREEKLQNQRRRTKECDDKRKDEAAKSLVEDFEFTSVGRAEEEVGLHPSDDKESRKLMKNLKVYYEEMKDEMKEMKAKSAAAEIKASKTAQQLSQINDLLKTERLKWTEEMKSLARKRFSEVSALEKEMKIVKGKLSDEKKMKTLYNLQTEVLSNLMEKEQKFEDERKMYQKRTQEDLHLIETLKVQIEGMKDVDKEKKILQESFKAERNDEDSLNRQLQAIQKEKEKLLARIKAFEKCQIVNKSLQMALVKSVNHLRLSQTKCSCKYQSKKISRNKLPFKVAKLMVNRHELNILDISNGMEENDKVTDLSRVRGLGSSGLSYPNYSIKDRNDRFQEDNQNIKHWNASHPTVEKAEGKKTKGIISRSVGKVGNHATSCVVDKYGHSYSRDEDKKILKFFVAARKNKDVDGNELWKHLETSNLVPGRNWQSMKKRFRKVIQKQIDSYGLDQDALSY